MNIHIFHFAHLDFLKKSRQFGESLVVALESDEFIRTRKHHEPFHDVQKRASLLAELECVDLVVILPLLTTDEQYLEMVQRLKPSIISLKTLGINPISSVIVSSSLVVESFIAYLPLITLGE